jgi:GNAT superfamily N-acetyltransferase
MPVTKYRHLNGKECIGKLDYKLEHENKILQFRLNLIFLEKSCRGRGLGKTIMEDVIKKAKRLGCKRIILSVTDPEYDMYSTLESRRKFFERLGFQFDVDGFGELNLIENNKLFQKL